MWVQLASSSKLRWHRIGFVWRRIKFCENIAWWLAPWQPCVHKYSVLYFYPNPQCRAANHYGFSIIINGNLMQIMPLRKLLPYYGNKNVILKKINCTCYLTQQPHLLLQCPGAMHCLKNRSNQYPYGKVWVHCNDLPLNVLMMRVGTQPAVCGKQTEQAPVLHGSI